MECIATCSGVSGPGTDPSDLLSPWEGSISISAGARVSTRMMTRFWAPKRGRKAVNSKYSSNRRLHRHRVSVPGWQKNHHDDGRFTIDCVASRWRANGWQSRGWCHSLFEEAEVCLLVRRRHKGRPPSRHSHGLLLCGALCLFLRHASKDEQGQ